MNAADPTPIVRPALLVYAFVPIDDDPARFADGWRYLTRLWDACRAMGMTDPLLGPGGAAELPAAPPGPGAFQVLASARRGAHGAGVRAAFLFVEHDTVGLVAAVSADNAGIDGWSAVLDEWLPLIADVDADMDLLGEVLVLVGYTPDGQTESPSLDHPVGPLASRLGADATAHPPTLTSSGIRVW